jgi:hypothetical protein
MKISVSGSKIVFPVELLGEPNGKTSWVAFADMRLDRDDLLIQIYRRPFSFDAPSLIYEKEKRVLSEFKGSFGKNNLPPFKVKRTEKTTVLHHISADQFLKDNQIPSGVYEYEKAWSFDYIVKDDSGQAVELVLRLSLTSARELQSVRSLLGFNGDDVVN